LPEGLNPIAAVEEDGIATYNEAMGPSTNSSNFIPLLGIEQSGKESFLDMVLA